MKKREKSAFQTLQGLAFSLLDQWLFSAKKANQKTKLSKDIGTEDISEVSKTHPMRYLFLLGVLPTTFGSLYSLGYTVLFMCLSCCRNFEVKDKKF